jgi:hypothetical protein
MGDTAAVTGSRSLLASLATALSLAAAMLVPSELIRLLCPRPMRRRVFYPRMTRLRDAGRSSEVPSPPLFPFSWLPLAWAVDDTEQVVVDEARARVLRRADARNTRLTLPKCRFAFARRTPPTPPPHARTPAHA